jgi:hypothetical protein
MNALHLVLLSFSKGLALAWHTTGIKSAKLQEFSPPERDQGMLATLLRRRRPPPPPSMISLASSRLRYLLEDDRCDDYEDS